MAGRESSSRERKVPAKYADVGGLGAACGPGAWATQQVSGPRLPGITGDDGLAATTTAAHGTPAVGGGNTSERVKRGTAGAGGTGIGELSDDTPVIDVESDPSDTPGRRLDPTSAATTTKQTIQDVGIETSGSDELNADDDDDGDSESSAESYARDVSRRGPFAGLRRKGKGKARRPRAPAPAPAPAQAPAQAPSSAPASSSATSLASAQKSLNRHKGKPYAFWPAFLLQTVCSARKITGMSKQKNVEVLADALESLDKVMERPSPHLADLLDQAAGGTPAANPTAPVKGAGDPPASLVLAVRAAVEQGMSPSPDKLFDGDDGKTYTMASILAVIAKEDGAKGGGSSTPRVHKSKHCLPRWVELHVDGRWRARVAASKTGLKRPELDTKQTGKTRSVNIDMWHAFKDKNTKVAESLATDENVVAAGINPNIVHQPDITFDKFVNMGRDVNKSFGEYDTNFRKSGSNGEWYSFCRGDMDAYYFGEVMRQYPEILAVCNQMMPEDVQRENTGVGQADVGGSGAEGAVADGARRDTAKRAAKEQNAHLAGKEKKQKKKEKELESAAKAAFSVCKTEVGLGEAGGGAGLFGGIAAAPALADAPTSWHDTKEGVESSAAKLQLSDQLYEALQKEKKRLRDERAKGDDADLEDIEYLENQVKKIRKRMHKASKDEL